MKIAVLFDNLGPYHHARLVALSSLADVLAVEFGSTSDVYEWRAESPQSLRHYCVNPSGSSRDLPHDIFRRKLEAGLDSYGPDVVAVPGWSNRGAFAAVAWCLRNGIPVVVMSESNFWDEKKRKIAERLKRGYLRLASAAIVGGSSHARYLEYLDVESSRIFKGYDVIDNSHFSKGCAAIRENSLTVRHMYNLPARFFLASGRFVLKKNLFRLLEAFALYRKSLSDGDAVDLVVLGDGQLRGELEVSIQKLCLRKHVHLPGFRQYDELPVYYSLAEAFIHPSTVEPWGLVVNEAMASGLPVIVSDRCGCAGELVHPGINGFIFDPTQVDALAELIAVVGASSFLRVDFGRAGQRIIASWGPERFANGLLSAVEKALDVGPKKAGPTDRFLLELLCRR